VPLAGKIRQEQAARLGLDNLTFYDEAIQFPEGNATPNGNPDWIINNGVKLYEQLSPETSGFIHEMMDKGLMDLVAKKGKAGGGYCTYISGHGAPFIFSNFNGTSADIDVLTHEVGHAFQVYLSRDQRTMEYAWPTSDAAEIHSMTMEYFTYPYMDLFFNDKADAYRFAHTLESLLFLPYGVAVDEFQHVVYTHPDMSNQERNDAWKLIEQKYLPHRNYDGFNHLEAGTWWQTQAHIYQSPFYYIDYTLAQICAFQFWMRSKKDAKKAMDDYIRLCKAGGSRSFLELVDYAELRSPFETNTVKEVVQEVFTWVEQFDRSLL
jgi:M3 family oligoendopeptidase